MANGPNSGGPLGGIFTFLGGLVGFGYFGSLASQSGAEGGSVIIAALIGALIGGVVGRVVENIVFRLIVIALVVIEFLANRLIWGSFWQGLTGSY